MRVAANSVAARRRSTGEPFLAVLDAEEGAAARREIAGWPVYAPTPMLSLDGLASEIGVARIWAKDEGARAPLQSFKALGGAYALGEVVRRHISEQGDRPLPLYGELFEGRHAGLAAQLHACCASAGNHGRSLAWAAGLFGARCTIYLAENVSAAKERAIADLGARTVRVRGTYDQAVAQCVSDAATLRATVIQDTSWPGSSTYCASIMCGYTILVDEALEQMSTQAPPTHVFLQVGCGGLAGAVVSRLYEHFPGDMPIIVLVQSAAADSLLRSFDANAMVDVGGKLETAMTGVAVGTLSLIAWQILQQCGDFAVAVSDGFVSATARLLVSGVGADPAVVTSATGAGGIAALGACAMNEEARLRIGLNASSRILAFITERGDQTHAGCPAANSK